MPVASSASARCIDFKALTPYIAREPHMRGCLSALIATKPADAHVGTDG